jgi:hypothetical protein
VCVEGATTDALGMRGASAGAGPASMSISNLLGLVAKGAATGTGVAVADAARDVLLVDLIQAGSRVGIAADWLAEVVTAKVLAGPSEEVAAAKTPLGFVTRAAVLLAAASTPTPFLWEFIERMGIAMVRDCHVKAFAHPACAAAYLAAQVILQEPGAPATTGLMQLVRANVPAAAQYYMWCVVQWGAKAAGAPDRALPAARLARRAWDAMGGPAASGASLSVAAAAAPTAPSARKGFAEQKVLLAAACNVRRAHMDLPFPAATAADPVLAVGRPIDGFDFNWDPLDGAVAGARPRLHPVAPGSAEFRGLEACVRASMLGLRDARAAPTVVSAHRVVHAGRWAQYEARGVQCAVAGVPSAEFLAWHGTRGCCPQFIAMGGDDDYGLTVRRAYAGGMVGAAVYVAEHLLYSCGGYGYPIAASAQEVRMSVLLCRFRPGATRVVAADKQPAFRSELAAAALAASGAAHRAYTSVASTAFVGCEELFIGTRFWALLHDEDIYPAYVVELALVARVA